MNVNLVAANERVPEGNIDGAVRVFNVEDHGVTAGFAPALNNLNAAIASRHQASQVNGTNFKVFGDGNSFLGDRRVQNSGDGQLLSSL